LEEPTRLAALESGRAPGLPKQIIRELSEWLSHQADGVGLTLNSVL
jgi:hypothetical protein